MHLFGYHDCFHHHGTTSFSHLHQHVRVVVMGAAAVGKTSLVQRALYNHFPDKYKETIEDTFLYKGDKFDLEIIDTSGSHNFPDMTKIAIMAGDVFILVFSVEDWSTFDRVAILRQQIRQLKGKDIQMIIVGNKNDSEDRKILPEVAESVACIDWSCKYRDISATDTDECCDVFNDVISFFPSLYGEKLKKPVHKDHVELPTKLDVKRSSKLRSSIHSIVKRVKSKLEQ